MDTATNALKDMPLFHDLTNEQLAVVSRLLHRKSFPAGAELITEQQPGEVAYLILSGSVKICVQGASGDNVIVAIRGVGEVVGEMSLVDGLGRSATVITQEPTTMLWIDRTAFWTQLWMMPPVPYNLTCILSRRLRLLTAQVQVMATLDVRGRLARQILSFAHEYGQNDSQGGVLIPFRLTQHELASMIGSSRVRVNQVLAYWKRRRYIALSDNHHLIVLNTAALQRQC